MGKLKDLLGKKIAIKSKPKEVDSDLPQIKKTYSKRLFMLVVSGAIAASGIPLFVVYSSNMNMLLGVVAVFLVMGGGISFRYFWGKTEDVVTEHIGKQVIEQVNSLCLYPTKIVFENVHNPQGYPWGCMNDKKKYYVNIWDEKVKGLVPFVLPDQQYYDPGVFAERVLELPAHRKIFTRKPDLFQKIKTGLLVLAIGIVWILIITTTGG